MKFIQVTALRPVVLAGQRVLRYEAGSKVEVFLPGGTFTELAPGVVDRGGNAQPLYTGAEGWVEVGAEDGTYDVRITHADGVQAPDRTDVLWGDVKQQRDEALAAAQDVSERAEEVYANAALVADNLAATQAARDAALAAGYVYGSTADAYAASPGPATGQQFAIRGNATYPETLQFRKRTDVSSSDFVVVTSGDIFPDEATGRAALIAISATVGTKFRYLDSGSIVTARLTNATSPGASVADSRSTTAKSVAAALTGVTDDLHGPSRIKQTSNGAAGTVTYADVAAGGVDITNASTTYYREISTLFERVPGTIQRFVASFTATSISASTGRVYLGFGPAGENQTDKRLLVFRGDGTVFTINGAADPLTQVAVLPASTNRDWAAGAALLIQVDFDAANNATVSVTAPDDTATPGSPVPVTSTPVAVTLPAGPIWVGTNTNGVTRINSVIGSGIAPVASQAISTKAAEVAAAAVAPVNSALLQAFLNPNFVNNDWTKTIALGSGASPRVAETWKGYDAVRVTRNPGAEWVISYPRSMFPGNKFSLSGVLVDATSTARRLMVIQRQAGTEVGTRITLSPANNNSLPALVSTPVEGADIDPSCDRLDLYISAGSPSSSSTASAWWANVMFGPGLNPLYRPYTGIAAPSGGMVWLSPNGSDGNIGTRTLPFATPNAAIAALGGVGTIGVLGDFGSTFQINPALVKDITFFGVWIAGAGSTPGRFPLIRCSTKLAGVVKTEGSTKIYQAPLSGITLQNFNWAWQDGASDERSLITLARRRAHHDGRTHRLPCTKLIKVTNVSSLASAKAEMDAASDPRAYIDEAGGQIYFTVANNADGSPGDGLAANVYVSSSVGLIQAGSIGSAGSLKLYGLDVRYGGVNLRPFASSYVNDLSVTGAAENCVDYGPNFSFGRLEVAGAGDYSGTIGDGLNGHSAPRVVGDALWAHDCRDEGFSPHEYGWTCIANILAEYNTSGIAIAAGAAAILSNVVTIGNSAYGINITLAPADNGFDTRAELTNWMSVADGNGIKGDPAIKCYGHVTNGKVFECTGVAYQGVTITDCGHDGIGTAKGPNVTVKNTALVV